MADPEIPARTKLKRKRCTADFDPEEVTEQIMDELRKSRFNIDNKLSKYNDAFMQIQSKKRRQFIDYCESQIRALESDRRSLVATRLLSNEEFAVEMNFSELHTSKGKSVLTWSCSDTSLSDPSWRTLLQQYVEGAAESSASRAGEVARNSQATSNSPSPSQPSTSIAEPSSVSTPMTLPEPEQDLYAFGEDDKYGDDPLSTPHVTISKTRRTGKKEQPVAQRSQKTPPTRGRGRAAKGEKRRHYIWSKEECEILRSLCTSNGEALGGPMFWEGVCARIPGRTVAACKAKWSKIKAENSDGERDSDVSAQSTSRRSWTRAELTKLESFRPRPGKPTNWVKAATQFHRRSEKSCLRQYGRKFGDPYEYAKTRKRDHSSSFNGAAADETSEELVKGTRTTEDREDDTEGESY